MMMMMTMIFISLPFKASASVYWFVNSPAYCSCYLWANNSCLWSYLHIL